MSAPERTRKGDKPPRVGDPVRPLRVKIGGITVDAVGIKDALFQPSEGDEVTTVPLSDGRVLLLGPS